MKIVALAGGVGGAKLVHGLAQLLRPDELSVIVNTGDDFQHYGLHISPDLDTVCYTLAGLANPETGWGRAGETWGAIDNAVRLGGPGWFRLGDHDLGTHLERTRRKEDGDSLTDITAAFCEAWGIHSKILPMTNQAVRTLVHTDDGELPFQDYFVRLKCEPRVRGFQFDGAQAAHPAPGSVEAISGADAIVICPSNPWVSIDPILSIPGLRAALSAKPIVAVSPIIAGESVKGPAAKMYRELGIEPSALAVAQHYGALLAGFVLDQRDAALRNSIAAIGVQALATNTLMLDVSDRVALARDVLHFAGKLK